jgi:hypothetical protein
VPLGVVVERGDRSVREPHVKLAFRNPGAHPFSGCTRSQASGRVLHVLRACVSCVSCVSCVVCRGRTVRKLKAATMSSSEPNVCGLLAQWSW